MSGTIKLTTLPRNLIEQSNSCKCYGAFGDLEWAFRCDSQRYCLSFFVRRTSTTNDNSATSTAATMTFVHYSGVEKGFTSSNFENAKWIRITQDITGKCDQVSVSMNINSAIYIKYKQKPIIFSHLFLLIFTSSGQR